MDTGPAVWVHRPKPALRRDLVRDPLFHFIAERPEHDEGVKNGTNLAP